MAHDGRDRTHARAARHAAPSARMGDRRAGEGRARRRAGDVRPAHGRCRRAGGRGRGAPGRPAATRRLAVGHAVHRALAAVARRGVGDQPAVARRRRRAAVGRRGRRSCARRRDGPGTSSRPSWERTTMRCRRTTSRRTPRRWWRIARRRRTSASICSPPWPRTTSAGSGLLDTVDRLAAHHRHDARSRALPRPLLQLVRDPDRRPLDPKYVSTVDSGNLAGHLLALREACRELERAPAPRPAGAHRHRRHRAGAARGAAHPRGRPPDADGVAQGPGGVPRRPRRGARAGARDGRRLGRSPVDPRDARGHDRPTSRAPCARSATSPTAASWSRWAEAIRAVVASHARDLDTLLPWARRTRGAAVRDAAGAAGRAMPSPADVGPTRCEAALAARTPAGTALAESRPAQSATGLRRHRPAA